MNILDLILGILFIAGIYIFLKKKREKSKNNTALDPRNPTNSPPSNYNALRYQQSSAVLHGISIISLYYDSPKSYADMDKDGTNTNFDLQCESKVNDVVNSLKADGYTPEINALSCIDRVIFYIIY